MAMVELSEEEVNIVPEPVLSHVDFESKTDLFKSFQYSSATWGTLFCRGSIFLTIYTYKSDDIIYEQPLKHIHPE